MKSIRAPRLAATGSCSASHVVLLSICFLVTALSLAGCASPTSTSTSTGQPKPPEGYRARILRTQGGIPHIRADDLGSLGFGTLYAMAEDNFCILAEQYLTFAAERSRFLGPDEGRLESDFFYQLLIDRGDAVEPLPTDLDALFAGAAAGYNRFLRDGRAGTSVDESASFDARCAEAEWIREVDATDIKRVSRIDYALAYMLPIVVAAAPPDSGAASDAEKEDEEAPDSAGAPTRILDPSDPVAIAAAVDAYLEVPKEGGSNGVALGRAVTKSARGMLLANPHMPWNEPFQRFYPMHQTIPGAFDMLGANLIGRPRVGFGHSESVAWTSTVSTAKRLSFYRLELAKDDPTRYVFDGEVRPMQLRTVEVSVRAADGTIETRAHTFYSTHFGGLLVESPFFSWTDEQAFAVRLVDAQWRGETSIADQWRARTVHELKAVHDRDQFLPVNLIAADAAGNVLYADPGPIPNLPDAVLEDCAVLRGAALDGSRSACQWRDDATAAAPGVFGPDSLPSLVREDFVTNSNDSFWLANPAAPLEGFPKSLGSERTKRTLRTRSSLWMVDNALARPDGVDLETLQALALANVNAAGQLIRDDVVELCRATRSVRITTAEGKKRSVDLRPACKVLANWDLHANLDSAGAVLFRQFLADAKGPEYVRYLPESFVPRVAFDPDDPVATPSGLAPQGNDVVLESLARAILELEAAGIPLGATLGEYQSVMRGDERIPLHGGPEFEGIFNKLEASFQGEAGYPEVDRWSSSWILAVEFTETGPRSRGLLTYSLSSNPRSAHFADQTRMYSRKQWVELPFRASDVEAAAERDYVVIDETRD